MKNNFNKISLFLSGIIFIFLCCVPVYLYKIINANNQKAESNMAAWQTETNRRNDITFLNESLKQVSSDRTLLATHFAQSSDVVPFLNTIEQLAPTAGAQAEIDSVNTGTNNGQLIVELKASGSFVQVYKFLTLLENSPYELSFLSVDIHKSSLTDAPSKNVTASTWEAIFKIQLLSFIP
jgi:hypothetical protein